MKKTDVREMLPLGSTMFYILLTLASGERHGYAIIKEVDDTTAGAIKLSPATLYRLIKQLLADAWIDEVPTDADDDPRRRYYRLTSQGRDIAKAEARRLADLVRVARARHLLPSAAL
ncbi:MAG TPA: PadR family transcriptional regulator [Candidatus Baltobacteraceae bacterium]|jgi:DNA-binding PadR family transcriptional regulator